MLTNFSLVDLLLPTFICLQGKRAGIAYSVGPLLVQLITPLEWRFSGGQMVARFEILTRYPLTTAQLQLTNRDIAQSSFISIFGNGKTTDFGFCSVPKKETQ